MSKSVKDEAYTQINRGGLNGFSILTPKWRYTMWDDAAGSEQLFDHSSDAGEMKNLASDKQYADTVKELRAKLTAYAANTPKQKAEGAKGPKGERKKKKAAK